MRRLASALSALLILSASTCTVISANGNSPFATLPYTENHQYTLSCAAHFECDVQLQPGERVNDGFNAHIDDWDPHIGYSGEHTITPHLVLRPSRPGLRTNIILTTTKRTYYLFAHSTSAQQPSYYVFNYQQDTYRALARQAVATQAALRASLKLSQPNAVPTPANVADLATLCFDYNYGYLVDRNVQTDHVPRARPSREPLPTNYVPKLVCSDGRHTYIEFPMQREVPSDLPISLAVTSSGDTLINYTYLSELNRFTIDGVYDSFVLELGSQAAPLRLRIYHAGLGAPNGRHDPSPIPIRTSAPATTAAGAVPTNFVPAARPDQRATSR